MDMNKKIAADQMVTNSVGYLLHANAFDTDDQFRYGLSLLTNFAFACELLIKAHTLYEGKEVQTIHKLDHLFAQLSKEVKSKIRQYVEVWFQGGIYGGIKFDFGSILAESADAFEFYRYPIDKDRKLTDFKRGHYGFLYRLAMGMIYQPFGGRKRKDLEQVLFNIKRIPSDSFYFPIS
jgi:hypothetical protein